MDLNLDPVRRLNEELMKDVIRIFRGPDQNEGVWDPVTGTYEEVPQQIIYEGPGTIWSAKEGSYQVTEGVLESMLTRYYIEIPMDTPEPLVEDIAVAVTIGPQGNQQLLGKEFLIRGLDHYSYSVGQIFRCEVRRQSP